MDFKQQVAAYLDDTQTTVSGWVVGAIAVLILVSAAIFVIETYAIPPGLRQGLAVVDWGILTLFTLEYGLRLWSAERWWQYALSPYGLLDLITILPFLLGFLDMRFVRLLRWLRVLRLVRFLDDRALVGRLTAGDTLAIVRIVFTLFAIIFIYAGIIFQLEEARYPDTFGTFLDAVYFSVVTMTTVGYGDITPISELGRLFTVLMILTGIALIPTQLGDLLRRVVKASHTVQLACDHCGWWLHDGDAHFCKRCGAALPLGIQASDLDPAGAPPLSSSPGMPFAPRSLIDVSEAAWNAEERPPERAAEETETP